MTRKYGIGESRNKADFQEIIESRPNIRYSFFWRSIRKRRSQLARDGKRLTDFWGVDFHAPWWPLLAKDFEYFLEQISARQELDDRLVALSAACFAWRGIEDKKDGRRRLKQAVKGEPELEAALMHHFNPPAKSADLIRAERSERESTKQYEKRQRKAEENKRAWIARLQENPERLRNVDVATVKAVWSDLYWLGMELSDLSKNTSGFSRSDWEVLIPTFGREVAEAARDGLMANWRFFRPQVKSENNTSNIPNGLLIGMIGLAIEAQERPDWPKYLTPDEAALAACYMTLEINGFPPWALRLLEAHPRECDAVISHELQWEFNTPAEDAPPYHVLHYLQYSAEELRAHYRPLVKEFLDQHEPANAQPLESAPSILLQWHDLDLSSFVELAQARCVSASYEKRFLTWLAAWMCIDADGALHNLRQWLEDAGDTAEADRRMIAFSGALISDWNIRFGSMYRDFERIEILRCLVPLMYAHVRTDEDISHEGVYSPDARDFAERARGYLLEKVCNTPGRASFDALMEFSQLLPQEWSRERLIVLARRRAGADAENEPWHPSDVTSFAIEGEKPPRSARELFNVGVSRLDDIKLDLEDGDYSEAPILLGIQQEPIMRNWFANRFRLLARGKYTVSPEEELADATRPDLRVHTSGLDTPIVIELKIADKWSFAQHCERIENQLIGQYLRDARSRFGIYLLVWQGNKKKWKADKLLNFHDLLQHLQEEADTIMRKFNDVEELLVIGIDLPKRLRRQ